MDIPSTRIPHTFKSFETRNGARIYRIPMNAFPSFWAYAYLVLVGEYTVLIDTGSGFGDSNANLEAGFEQASREIGRTLRIEDLTHILLTHGHIDHIGGLPFLKERTAALVGIHELDLGTLISYEERAVIAENRLKTYLFEAGVAQKNHELILNFYRFNKGLTHSVPVDFTYGKEGMRIGPFQMMHVPGHCPGHVVIRLDEILFSGDHVLNNISPHQWPERLTLYTGLGHYLGSLALVLAWAGDITLTLTGHNDPIPDLKSRVNEIRQLHADRLKTALVFFSEPHSVADVSQKLFSKVKGYDILLAIEEAGAHVEYLHQRGLLQIVNMAELEAAEAPVAIRYQRITTPATENIDQSFGYTC